MAGAGSKLLLSTDGGRSWSEVDTTWQDTEVRHEVLRLAFAPNDASLLLLATDSGVWSSRDGGRTVTRFRGPPGRRLEGLSFGGPARDVWAVGATNGDVYWRPAEGEAPGAGSWRWVAGDRR